jgi:hypothetical protein
MVTCACSLEKEEIVRHRTNKTLKVEAKQFIEILLFRLFLSHMNFIVNGLTDGHSDAKIRISIEPIYICLLGMYIFNNNGRKITINCTQICL